MDDRVKVALDDKITSQVTAHMVALKPEAQVPVVLSFAEWDAISFALRASDTGRSEAEADLLRRACRPKCYVPPGDTTARALWDACLVSVAPGAERWLVNTLPAGRTALSQPAKGEDNA